MLIHILLAIKALLKDITALFVGSYLKVITSITILFKTSLILKPGAIYDLIIFNSNYYQDSEKPFMLAHEIGHVINGNPGCDKLVNGLGKEESIADKFAIDLLLEYCLDQDIWFDNIYDFAESFGIPSGKYYLLEKMVS